jgi:hypothetical protein
MANKFQVKRTAVSGRTPNTTSSGNTHFIDTGELALNLTDGKMFSSNGTAYFEVGANLAVLSVSGNASIAAIVANGALGTSGQVLKTSGSSVYWGTVSGGGGSSVTMSDTAPGGAGAGDLWWDTSSGRLYIYYDDGTSLQWVDASPGIPGPAGVDGVDGVDGADGADGAGFTSSTNGEINSLGVGTPPSNVTGEIRAAATITAFYSSDKRIKTNILDIQNPIDKVKAIRGVTFSWTQEEIDRRGGIDGKFVRAEEVGVIAQDVENVLPHVVAERPDGFKAVRYEMIVPLLIESIKEQQKQIEELQQLVRSI